MKQPGLAITMPPGWQSALRATGRSARANTCQGEVLNFLFPTRHSTAKQSVKSNMRANMLALAIGEARHIHAQT